MKRVTHILFTVTSMDELLIKAIVVSALISINAAVAGTLTVFRRASFLIAGSAHSALAGVAVALFLNSIGIGVHYFISALVAAMFAALLSARASRWGDINTGIATAFALSMAVAVIFISMTGNAASAWQFLFGDILLLTDNDFILISISTAFVLVVTSFLYYKFLFISFDPNGAEAAGIDVHLYDLALISLISLSVVSALKAIGAILVFSIFIAPSASAKEIGKSTRSVFVISFTIAILSMYSALSLSFYYPLPAGALAALFSSITYFIITARKII